MKKINESIDKEKVLNTKYVNSLDESYGLLPSNNSVIAIKKEEDKEVKEELNIAVNKKYVLNSNLIWEDGENLSIGSGLSTLKNLQDASEDSGVEIDRSILEYLNNHPANIFITEGQIGSDLKVTLLGDIAGKPVKLQDLQTTFTGLKEDYTQASNAGAIKVDILGQSNRKKNKKGKEDPIIKSLPAQQVLIESEQLEDINWILDEYDIDITTKEELGSDYYYHTLVTNVNEAEKFNYHSDYWGDADSYQEDMVNLMYQIEPYINKNVIIDIDGESYKYKLLGVLIDKQYNSISHAELLIEEINDTITENKKVKTEGLYDYCYNIADHTELKEIALNVIYVANNDKAILEAILDHISDDFKDEYEYELSEFEKAPYDFIANNYNNLTTEFLREIALNAVYVANDDEAIQKEINDRKIESKKLKIENKDEFKDLELKIAKEINTYLINRFDIDLTDGDNSDYIEYIEECLQDFVSSSILDYEDQNNLELTWDYKLDNNVPYGIKVNVWEV